jgi:hypothetical protein
MNSFQRKSLYAALAGAGALGAVGTAQAVGLNPNGLGQVLIYPYYTVNADASGNAFNSLLSVVNTTDSAKAVKVRFLEGKNSREVLDFNLFLSKHDVWTAAVLPSSSGGGKVLTFDESCTIPSNSFLKAGVDFVNYAYTGAADDKGGTGLDRTKEGYVEIIEMATYWPHTCTSIQVTHVGGVPFDCAGVNDAQAGGSFTASSASGGLFGGMSLINVADGVDYTEDAVALTSFNNGPLYSAAGLVSPQLTDAFPPVSATFGDEGTTFVQKVGGGLVPVFFSNWPNPPYNKADPVSAVLMRNQVMNEYVLDATTKSATDWVITFPTKRFYVNAGTGPATKLFQRNFNDGAGACDDITLHIYDREEKTTSSPVTFSPPPPVPGVAICWEANVITFNNGNVLDSANLSNINTGNQNGWLNLTFSTSTSAPFHSLGNQTNTFTDFGGNTSSNVTVTYWGLPLVGFAVQSFTNGTLVVGGTNVLSNYGGNFVHKTTTLVTC